MFYNLRRHYGHDHSGDVKAKHHSHSRFRLKICFWLTAGFMILEVAAGLWTNSLALLSDAAHMLSDAFALGLASGAAHIALRKPTSERTFGHKRFEVLAAFVNALVLIALSLGLAYKSFLRFWDPQSVLAGPMMVIAALGLLLNLVILAWLQMSQEQKSLNEESVFWHVLGDALGSIAAFIAGALMVWKGWLWADPAATLLIAGVLCVGATRVLKKSGHILIEGAPEGLDLALVRQSMLSTAKVKGIHDLHAWTLSGKDLYLSAHVDIESGLDPEPVVDHLRRHLKQQFGIQHVTLQTGHGAEECENGCAGF